MEKGYKFHISEKIFEDIKEAANIKTESISKNSSDPSASKQSNKLSI